MLYDLSRFEPGEEHHLHSYRVVCVHEIGLHVNTTSNGADFKSRFELITDSPRSNKEPGSDDSPHWLCWCRNLSSTCDQAVATKKTRDREPAAQMVLEIGVQIVILRRAGVRKKCRFLRGETETAAGGELPLHDNRNLGRVRFVGCIPYDQKSIF